MVSSAPYPYFYKNTIDNIPPFSSVTLPISFALSDLFTAKKGKITATVNGESSIVVYTVVPIYVDFGFVAGLVWIFWFSYNHFKRTQT